MIIIAAVRCPWCGRMSEVEVEEEELELFQRDQGRTDIQYLLPRLNVHERELLKTGICGRCWDTLEDPEERSGRFRGEV